MKKILIAFILSSLTFFITFNSFSQEHATLISLVVFLITLWTNEGLPLGVVSLLPIILFPSFDILTTNETTANYSKSIIFLFLGGFLMAIATQKIDLHRFISNKLLKIFPATPKGILYSLAMTSAFLSSLISNTTTALLLIPISLFLSNDASLKFRFVLSIAYGSSIGGIITPIGTPPNLILLGFFEENQIAAISFIKWMSLTLPLAVVMLIFVPLILYIGVNSKSLDYKIEDKIITKDQKRLLIILGLLVVLLFTNSSFEPYYSGLGLNEKGILLGFGLLMLVPKIGFITWSDVSKVPFEIIFLFGAGFSIATAFFKTGLASNIAESLISLTSLPPLVLIFLIVILITFSSEVTSNTALISIALPIIYSIGKLTSLEPTILLFVATIAASYAFMLPTATPPNAIAISSGVVKIKDMAKIGFVFNISGVLLITFFALTYWIYYI